MRSCWQVQITGDSNTAAETSTAVETSTTTGNDNAARSNNAVNTVISPSTSDIIATSTSAERDNVAVDTVTTEPATSAAAAPEAAIPAAATSVSTAAPDSQSVSTVDDVLNDLSKIADMIKEQSAKLMALPLRDINTAIQDIHLLAIALKNDLEGFRTVIASTRRTDEERADFQKALDILKAIYEK